MVSRRKLAEQRAIQSRGLYAGSFDYVVPPGKDTADDYHTRDIKVDVVIPARNEQETIRDVVRAFQAAKNIGQIIVVNDRSTDLTGEIAQQCGAMVINGPGIGKGQAMMRGLTLVASERVIFADADLRGFTPNHATALAQQCYGQIVGLRDKGGTGNTITVLSSLPPIAGERSLPTRLARSVSLDKYGAEMQLNAAIVRAGLVSYHFIMRNVSAKMKAGPLRIVDVLPYIGNAELLQYGRSIKWLSPIDARWPDYPHGT